MKFSFVFLPSCLSKVGQNLTIIFGIFDSMVLRAVGTVVSSWVDTLES